MTEYIIKVDEDKKDIMGNCPLVEKPQELVRCKECKHYDGLCGCKLWHDVGSHSADWYCADGEKA